MAVCTVDLGCVVRQTLGMLPDEGQNLLQVFDLDAIELAVADVNEGNLLREVTTGTIEEGGLLLFDLAGEGLPKLGRRLLRDSAFIEASAALAWYFVRRRCDDLEPGELRRYRAEAVVRFAEAIAPHLGKRLRQIRRATRIREERRLDGLQENSYLLAGHDVPQPVDVVVVREAARATVEALRRRLSPDAYRALVWTFTGEGGDTATAVAQVIGVSEACVSRAKACLKEVASRTTAGIPKGLLRLFVSELVNEFNVVQGR